MRENEVLGAETRCVKLCAGMSLSADPKLRELYDTAYPEDAQREVDILKKKYGVAP